MSDLLKHQTTESVVVSTETVETASGEGSQTMSSTATAVNQQNSSKSKKSNVLNSSVNLYTFVKLWNHTVKLVMSRKPSMFDGSRVMSDVTFFRQCVRKYKLNINTDNALTYGQKRSMSNCSDTDGDHQQVKSPSHSAKRVRRDGDTEFDKLNNSSEPITVAGVTISEVIESEPNGADDVLNFTEIPENVYLEVFDLLFVALEFEEITYTFSREYLRYFLASYSKIINLSDFKNTNKLNKPASFDEKTNSAPSTISSKNSFEKNTSKSSSRIQDSVGSGDESRSADVSGPSTTSTATVTTMGSGSLPSSNSRKNKNINSAGGILLEYYKTPNNFKLLLTKCEHSDADALKYVVNLKLKLPSSIYRERGSEVQDKFETLTDCSPRAGFVKTAVSSGKTYVLCLTRHAVMVWDKNVYALPPVSLEKELPISATYGIFKNNTVADGDVSTPNAACDADKYVLYVLSSSNKLTLVDVISIEKDSARVPDLMNLPYAQRCAEMTRRLNSFSVRQERPSLWNCAEIESDAFTDSCLFLPLMVPQQSSDTICTRYTFTKPEHIVAVFGMEKHNVLVAYARNDKEYEFEYKLKIPISGPASFTILTESVRYMEASEENDGVIVEDRVTEAECRIFDVPYSSDSLIFEKIIPVQLLNSKQLEMPMFHRQITRASEYRLPLAREPVSSKPQSFEKMLAKHLMDNQNNLYKMIQTINLQLSDDQKEEIKNGLVISEKITEIKMNFK